MRKEDKSAVIEELKDKFSNSQYFYLTDSSTLTVEDVNSLRRLCFEKDVQLKVYKNTLIRKALEAVGQNEEYTGLYEALKGPTSIMFTTASNVPAKIIKEFRKEHERPLLKAAYIDTDIFLGDDQVETLSNLKSKEELIGDIILLLQSPMKNVVGALQSGGHTISGLLKSLSEREEG